MPREKVRGTRTPGKRFTLKLPKFLTMPQVHVLIARAQPIIQGGEVFDRFTVDASELTHISPVGLATLASVVRHASHNGRFRKGIFRVPQRKNVRTYLSRMNFDRLIGLRGIDRARRSPRRGRFRELVEVETADDCVSVTEQLRAVLTKKVPLTAAILNNVAYCLLEVLENVIHHAQSPINGLACAQAYPRTHAVEIAIVDCGIGVRDSLRKNPQHASSTQTDRDAILLALQKGVTSTPGRNTGEGLFFVAELMTRSGRMRLQSGQAMLGVSRRGMVTKDAPAWPGTLVGLRFELRRAVPLREIFAKFTHFDEESGLFRLEEVVTKEE